MQRTDPVGPHFMGYWKTLAYKPHILPTRVDLIGVSLGGPLQIHALLDRINANVHEQLGYRLPLPLLSDIIDLLSRITTTVVIDELHTIMDRGLQHYRRKMEADIFGEWYASRLMAC